MMEKKIFLSLILAIFLISILPLSFAFLPTKIYNPATETISILDAVNNSVVNITLLKNTDTCGTNCYAILEFEPYTNFSVTDDNYTYNWIFKENNTEGNQVELSYGIYKNTTIHYNKNNSDAGEWQQINFADLNFTAGNKEQIKLAGTKQQSQTIEWISIFYGFQLYEWTTWTAGTTFGRIGSYSWGTCAGTMSGKSVVFVTDNDGVWVYQNSSNLWKTYYLDWTETSNGDRGCFFNGTHLTYTGDRGPSPDEVRLFELKTNTSSVLFYVSEGEACGIAGQNFSSFNDWYWIYYGSNGTIVREDLSGTTLDIHDITAICGSSWSGVNANSGTCGGLGYNGSDWFVKINVGDYPICHIKSDWTNASDGFFINAGERELNGQGSINTNSTYYYSSRGGTTPYYASLPPAIDTSFTVSLPANTNEAIFNSTNKTQHLIKPINQTNDIPIFNISNTGNVYQDFKMKLTNEPPNWVVTYADDSNTLSSGIILSTTTQIVINNLANGQSRGIWMYSNFTNAPHETNQSALEISSQQHT